MGYVGRLSSILYCMKTNDLRDSFSQSKVSPVELLCNFITNRSVGIGYFRYVSASTNAFIHYIVQLMPFPLLKIPFPNPVHVTPSFE
jgi:hypothetical protein